MRAGWEAVFLHHPSKQLERVVQYSTRYYSELTWVYSKKDTSCARGKWWPNSILTLTLLTWKIGWANNASRWQMEFNLVFKGLIKKYISFTAVSISFVHPLYILPSYIVLGWLDKLCRNLSLYVGVLFNSLPCLSVFINAFQWFCFVNLFFISTFHYVVLTYWWGVYDLNLLGEILLVSCQRPKHVDVRH